MIKRRISLIAGIAIIVLAVLGSRYLSNQKKPQRRAPQVSDIQLVRTSVVQNRDIESAVEVTGKLTARNKVEVFAEVSGTLAPNEKPFKEGVYYEKGEVMLHFEDNEARLNLLAQKSNVLNLITTILPEIKIDYSESADEWVDFVKNFDLEAPLPTLPEPRNQREKFYFASKNLYNYYYNIKSQEARIEKYTIRAPFSGMLTEANINPGTLVRTGQKLGEFINVNDFEMEASLGLRDRKFIKVGDKVGLQSPDVAGEWTGTVIRINDRIDPNTQTIMAYIAVSSSDLREGMYLKGKVKLNSINYAAEIPRKLLVDDNTVYVVEDSVLRPKPVEIVRMTDETAIVKGLKDGTKLLEETMAGIYDGMKVKTYN